MLKQRLLTAAVLLAVFIAALAAPTPAPFMALTLLLIAAAGWEWSRLVGWPGWRAWASGALCAALGLAVWTCFTSLGDDRDWSALWVWFGVLALCSLACLLWIFGGAWLLWRGVGRWPKLPQWLRWGLGMVLLPTAWLALTGMAQQVGLNFLLSALGLVWAADIAAYFFGRALGGKLTGGRKLAPMISPGKSWEGAAGGFIGVLLISVIWMAADRAWHLAGSLYTLLWNRGPLGFVCTLAALTAMSIVGDLTESLVKRAAGVKDSSALLPGHGGVLDRIDALLPTLPLTLLIASAPW